MGKIPVLGFVLLLSLASGAARAQESPVQLADVHPGSEVPAALPAAPPSGFFRLGDRLLFSTGDASAPDDGTLWSTDGTEGGTFALSSALCPAPCDGIKPLGVWHGLGLLQTSSGGSSSDAPRLWRTDGTPAGTFPLTGYLTNRLSGKALEVVASPDSEAFFFLGCVRVTYECTLWRSDGTRKGTSILAGVDGASFHEPHGLTFWRGRLYFVAASGEQTALWSTDGTAQGTERAAAVEEAFEQRSVVRATSSHLFFGSGEGAEDLWALDDIYGTARKLADFDLPGCYPPPNSYCDSPDLSTMFVADDQLYFHTRRAGHGVEIWTSDGTSAGTRPLTELAFPMSFVGRPVRIAERWLFQVSSGGRTSFLWTAGPGFTGLAPLTGCRRGVCPRFVSFLGPTESGRWLFAGRDVAHGAEVWMTDGTGPGTYLLADVCPGPCGGFRPDAYPPSATYGSLAGQTYFPAFSSSDPGSPYELWVTDGTSQGTRRVAVGATSLGFFGGLTYFGTGGFESASRLWRTDGTPEGTRPVATVQGLFAGSYPVFHELGGRAVFSTFSGDGQSLWLSDGRPEGTTRYFDFPAEVPRRVDLLPWARVGNVLFFRALAGVSDRVRVELWRTDGTAQGTRRMASPSRRTNLGFLTAWNGKLLFQQDVAGACSFWSSDGTQAGTREIVPAEPGRRCPTAVLPLGERFVFVARVESPEGIIPQIFVSDGTRAGTRQVSRIRSSREPLFGDEPVAVGGAAFFGIRGPGQSIDSEVWRTDGTPEGTYRAFRLRNAADLQGFRGSLYLTATLGQGRGVFRLPLRGGEPVLLADLGPYYGAYYSASFTPLGDRLLFRASELAHGTELWATDGTPQGTLRLRDIQPGPKSSGLGGLTAAGDRVFFSAGDGEHGLEVWESDGTPEGTRLAWDLNPGGYSSLAGGFTKAGDFLFFGADDGKTGFEPWVLRIGAASSPPRN